MWCILKEHKLILCFPDIFQDLCFATELETMILLALCMQFVLKSIQLKYIVWNSGFISQ